MTGVPWSIFLLSGPPLGVGDGGAPPRYIWNDHRFVGIRLRLVSTVSTAHSRWAGRAGIGPNAPPITPPKEKGTQTHTSARGCSHVPPPPQ